jgi:AcrR family transcriptional regulator
MASMGDGPRERLIEAGIRLLEREGPQALQARKVAEEVGSSTMAVYTHFGGMTGLLEGIAGKVFARFTQALTEIPQTDDAVADFLAMGGAYRRFALENPQRYLLIFGFSSPQLFAKRADLTVTGSPADHGASASFEALLKGVRRMIAAGRIRDDGELAIAGRFWSLLHGTVMLEMAGFFGQEGHGLTQILGPLAIDVFVGMGDDREKTTRSMMAAGAHNRE